MQRGQSDFAVTVDSLRTTFGAYLRPTAALGFWLSANEAAESVHLLVCLEDASWSAKAEVLDRLSEAHEMYVDELAVTYSLADGSCAPAEAVGRPEGVYASVR